MTEAIHVLLADDHPALRVGLRVLLEQAADIVVVDETGDGQEALAQIEALRPEVAVLDCELPGMAGAEVAAWALHPAPRPAGRDRAHGGVSCEQCAGQAGAEFAGAGGGVGAGTRLRWVSLGTGAPAWGIHRRKTVDFHSDRRSDVGYAGRVTGEAGEDLILRGSTGKSESHFTHILTSPLRYTIRFRATARSTSLMSLPAWICG